MQWGLGDEQGCFALLLWHTLPPLDGVSSKQTALVIAEVTSQWDRPCLKQEEFVLSDQRVSLHMEQPLSLSQ